MTQPPDHPHAALLTRSAAAEYLGLPISLLDHLARTGEGPTFIRPGSRVTFYARHDLDAWRDQRRRAPHV